MRENLISPGHHERTRAGPIGPLAPILPVEVRRLGVGPQPDFSHERGQRRCIGRRGRPNGAAGQSKLHGKLAPAQPRGAQTTLYCYSNQHGPGQRDKFLAIMPGFRARALAGNAYYPLIPASGCVCNETTQHNHSDRLARNPGTRALLAARGVRGNREVPRGTRRESRNHIAQGGSIRDLNRLRER